MTFLKPQKDQGCYQRLLIKISAAWSDSGTWEILMMPQKFFSSKLQYVKSVHAELDHEQMLISDFLRQLIVILSQSMTAQLIRMTLTHNS